MRLVDEAADDRGECVAGLLLLLGRLARALEVGVERAGEARSRPATERLGDVEVAGAALQREHALDRRRSHGASRGAAYAGSARVQRIGANALHSPTLFGSHRAGSQGVVMRTR